jgi:hypothetical protein
MYANTTIRTKVLRSDVEPSTTQLPAFAYIHHYGDVDKMFFCDRDRDQRVLSNVQCLVIGGRTCSWSRCSRTPCSTTWAGLYGTRHNKHGHFILGPTCHTPIAQTRTTSRAPLEEIPKVTPTPRLPPLPRAREAKIPRTPAAMATALPLALAAAVLAMAPLPAGAVWLEVPQSGTKCVSEEIQSNVVVLADYAIMFESHHDSHPTIAIKVS